MDRFRYMERFLQSSWEVQVKALLGEGASGKKPKKKNNLIKKLNSLGPEVKVAACKEYIQRCKLRHYFRMLEWKYQNLPEETEMMERTKMALKVHDALESL